MAYWTDKSITVEAVDNGWVLEWKDEAHNSLLDEFRGMSSSTERKRKTRGTELFTDRKKLMKRIQSLI